MSVHPFFIRDGNGHRHLRNPYKHEEMSVLGRIVISAHPERTFDQVSQIRSARILRRRAATFAIAAGLTDRLWPIEGNARPAELQSRATGSSCRNEALPRSRLWVWYLSILFFSERCIWDDHPESGSPICDIRYVNNSASLNGTKQKPTESRCCQATGCAKLGSPRFIVDRMRNPKWTYFMCDEHFGLLSDSDKRYIARTEGTKVA